MFNEIPIHFNLHEKTRAVVTSARDTITSAITSARNTITNSITSSQNTITTAITTAKNNITSTINGYISSQTTTLSNAIDTATFRQNMVMRGGTTSVATGETATLYTYSGGACEIDRLYIQMPKGKCVITVNVDGSTFSTITDTSNGNSEQYFIISSKIHLNSSNERVIEVVKSASSVGVVVPSNSEAYSLYSGWSFSGNTWVNYVVENSLTCKKSFSITIKNNYSDTQKISWGVQNEYA